MEASTPNSNRPTLLIVDDEPLMTELFRHFMTKRDFRVLTAAGGPEALAIVEAEGDTVRLVITDMSMPEMDGLDVAKRLADLRPDLPVLIATGHDADSTGMPLPPNVVGIVQKPYQNRVLAERIQQILAYHAPKNPPAE